MIIESAVWLACHLSNHVSPAVVPSLLGPLQALMLLLPQMLLGLVLVLDSLTNPSAWREAATRLWTTMRTKPVKAVIWLCITDLDRSTRIESVKIRYIRVYLCAIFQRHRSKVLL